MRVLVAEADFLRATTLYRIASALDGFELCSLAHTAGAAMQIGAGHSPALVLLGLTFADLDGLDLIDVIASSQPGARLIVVAEPRDERTRAVLRHTAKATYLNPHSETTPALCSAIRNAATMPPAPGRNRLSPTLAEPVGAPAPISHFLSEHLQLVFSVLGAGYNDDQAALVLGMGLEAVRSCRKRVMSRLGLHSHPELMRLALQRGYVRFAPHGVQHPGFESELAMRRPSAGCAMIA